MIWGSLWQTNEEASRVVSKNTDFVYFCSPISGMAIAPNSLSSGLNRAVKHFLQHQSCWGFQLVFLISNDLDGDAADWNALGASVNCDPAQNVESAESRGSDDLIPKEIAQKLAVELNMPEKYFAEKVLNWSQGSFSDYLTKAPPTMPKSHSHGIWQRLQQFLESEEEQEELREQFREGKLNEPFISF